MKEIYIGAENNKSENKDMVKKKIKSLFFEKTVLRRLREKKKSYKYTT